MVAGALRRDDFVICFDMSDAYKILYKPEFCRFLQFKFQGKLFQIRAMPFGLCSTLRLFWKLIRAVAQFCKHQGFWIIVYLNDTIIMVRSRWKALEAWDFVIFLSYSLSSFINMAKSDLAPAKQFTFLGLNWDIAICSVALMKEKVQALKAAAGRLREQGNPLYGIFSCSWNEFRSLCNSSCQVEILEYPGLFLWCSPSPIWLFHVVLIVRSSSTWAKLVGTPSIVHQRNVIPPLVCDHCHGRLPVKTGHRLGSQATVR